MTLRFNHVREALCSFGDTSGTGFASTIVSSNASHTRIGEWCTTEIEETSSNWKELDNMTESLEEEGEKGVLRNVAIFFFVDNETVESGYAKGNSSSPSLPINIEA